MVKCLLNSQKFNFMPTNFPYTFRTIIHDQVCSFNSQEINTIQTNRLCFQDKEFMVKRIPLDSQEYDIMKTNKLYIFQDEEFMVKEFLQFLRIQHHASTGCIFNTMNPWSSGFRYFRTDYIFQHKKFMIKWVPLNVNKNVLLYFQE